MKIETKWYPPHPAIPAIGILASQGMVEAWTAWPDSRQSVVFGKDYPGLTREQLEVKAREFLAIDMLPDDVKRDVLAVRSMRKMLDSDAGREPKVARDLRNRISQALGRVADWEDANIDLAKRIGEAAAA